jgi:hypothetical protein
VKDDAHPGRGSHWAHVVESLCSPATSLFAPSRDGTEEEHHQHERHHREQRRVLARNKCAAGAESYPRRMMGLKGVTMRAIFLIGLVGLGCAGADDDGEAAPVECDRDDRRGTYLIEYRRTDGTCGNIPDALARIDGDNVTGAAECFLTEQDRWSRNDCRLERSFACEFDGFLYLYTGVTDSNASGSKIEGPLQVTVDGECTGTYDVTWTRQ